MKKLLLALVFVLFLLTGFRDMPFNIYYVKVIGIDGTVIAAPLDVADVSFTQVAYVNGQPTVGSFQLDLLSTWDAKYRRAMYATLLPEQRVEIYSNRDLLGDPVFTGVIRRRANSLAGVRLIKGDDITRRLEARRLRSYQQLTGNAATLIQSLLNTYNAAFTDQFANLSAWTNSGGWSVSGNVASATVASGGTVDATLTSPTYTAAQWDNAKISYDIMISSPAGTAGCIFDTTFPQNAGTRRAEVAFAPILPVINSLLQNIVYGINTSNAIDVNLGYVNKFFNYGKWNHVDIYTSVSAGLRRVIVEVNGLEVINVTDTTTGASHTGAIELYVQNSDASPVTFSVANFVFAPATAALTPGTIASTSVTIDQQFNGDTQLAAIQWICNYLGWTYRVRPKAGAGNDLFDCGATVGTDWTGTVTLSDGQDHSKPANLESLTIDESFDGIATWLRTYGQSRDDVTSGFISTNLAAMANYYGIVEQEYSDPRVISSDIAKVVGDARLAILGAGAVSLSARIKDESYLFQVGDVVPVKSGDLNINKNSTIVSLTKKASTPGIDIVFDYHGWTQSMLTQRLNSQVVLLTRTLTQQIDTQTLVFPITGAASLTLSFNMRGNLYKQVYIDVTSNAWGSSNPTFGIDGTNRAVALFGATNISANSFGIDTQWLIYSGVHTITIATNGTGTFTVQLRPVLMG